MSGGQGVGRGRGLSVGLGSLSVGWCSMMCGGRGQWLPVGRLGEGRCVCGRLVGLLQQLAIWRRREGHRLLVGGGIAGRRDWTRGGKGGGQAGLLLLAQGRSQPGVVAPAEEGKGQVRCAMEVGTALGPDPKPYGSA